MSSHFNNTTTPLEVSQTWVGGNEITKPNNLICVSVNSSSYCLITIKQTNDLIHYDQVDSYNVSPTGGRYIQEFSKCTYCHVEVENVDTVAQTYLSVATTFTNQTQLQDSIIVSNTIGNPLHITGNVGTTPVLSSAQLRNTPLVLGHWYEVASTGDTIGAVWAEMGAIWDGENLPPIGRQFQCLYAGYGTGTCYDITAPIAPNQTIAVSNLPTISTAGRTLLSVSVDGWSIGNSIGVVIDTDGNTVKIDSSANTVSIAPNQSINIVNSGYQYNTGVLSIGAGGILTSSAVNINNYNLVDVYLLFGNTIDPSDTYLLQISPDNGTTWFSSSYFTLMGAPSQGTLQLNTSATQIRVKGGSLMGNTVNIWITAKST